jgi:hypothetical protein
LPGVEMLRGNTDRYVLTGEQPAPHLRARLHPNAEFLDAVLTGKRSQRKQGSSSARSGNE